MRFFFIALFSSAIIIWVFQAVNYLDIMIEDGRDYVVYLKYSALNFPKIFSKLLPFILFFSIFYVTIRYETNNELMILWNFGVHKMSLIKFMVITSFFLMLLQIILTSLVVPKSQDLARTYLKTSTINFFESFIKPQKFNDTIKGITIFSEKKDKDGNLYNLYLKKEIDENNFELIYAKKGIFKEFNNTPVLVLFDGESITEKNNEVTNFSFSKSDFPLNNIETNTITYKKTQELSSLNLFECLRSIYRKDKIIKIENCKISNLKNLFKETYKRIIIPFYIPLFVLTIFLLLLYSKENSNYNNLKTITFMIGLLSIIFSEITIRLISENIYKNIYIASLPFISFLILYTLITVKLNPKQIK